MDDYGGSKERDWEVEQDALSGSPIGAMKLDRSFACDNTDTIGGISKASNEPPHELGCMRTFVRHVVLFTKLCEETLHQSRLRDTAILEGCNLPFPLLLHDHVGIN